MPRRPTVNVLAAALSFAGGCSLQEPPLGAGVENVIVLSVDALGPGFLPVYDASAKAPPHLDRFSGRAVVFRNAFSTASWTLPAHASLLTGLYPDRHGSVRPGRRLSRDQETLASLMHEKGIETVAFTGGGFLSSSFGFATGFDRYNGWTGGRRWRPNLKLHRAGAKDERLFDRAVAYLRDVGRENRRFFLFLHTYFVHDYYQDPENEELKVCVLGQKPCGPQIWDELKTRYQDRLDEFDEGFGRLLSALEEAGLDESTLVVVLSDHGEGFEPERGRIHHGGRLHEDVIRVPLLVAGPGLTHRFVEEHVSLVDVVPTLGEIFGLAMKGSLDGLSFASDLYPASAARRPAGPRPLYAMEHAYQWVDGARVDFRAPEDGPAAYALIYRRFYYIRQADREELYDRSADPGQRHDLAASAPDLAPFREAVEARSGFEEGGEGVQIDSELEDRLRSLGYIR